MARFISGSVGSGGVNLREDVRVIQEMLNRVPTASGGPVPLLATDSLVGPLTIGAIRRFQTHHFGWNDGRVDTNNVTIAKLNTFDTTPAATAPVRFAHENPLDVIDGFDDAATPNPWQMVPRGGVSRLRLINGGSFSLLTSNPRVVTVEREVIAGTVGRLFTGVILLRGVGPSPAPAAPGQPEATFIRVLDGAGTQVARLDIHVKDLRPVATSFHYVQNARYGTRTRNVGDETALLAEMNRFYVRQTNIRFVRRNARGLPLSANLGVEINTDLATLGGDWRSVANATNRDPNAEFNVFFVRELEIDTDGETPGVVNPTDTLDGITTIGGTRDCLFEDGSGANPGALLAHEAGHALGLPDANDPQNLMISFSSNRVGKIRKDQANTMHTNAGRRRLRP